VATFPAMSSDLFEGDRHSLVLRELVPLAEPVEHARAEISTDGILNDLIMGPSGPRRFPTNGAEHLVIKLDGCSAPWHNKQFASLLTDRRWASAGSCPRKWCMTTTMAAQRRVHYREHPPGLGGDTAWNLTILSRTGVAHRTSALGLVVRVVWPGAAVVAYVALVPGWDRR